MLWAPGKTKIIVKRPKNIESEILALSRKVLAIHSSDTKNNIIIIWVILSQRISMGFHSACYRVCDQVQWLTAVTKSLKPQLKVRRSWIGSQRCVRTAAHPVERYDAKNRVLSTRHPQAGSGVDQQHSAAFLFFSGFSSVQDSRACDGCCPHSQEVFLPQPVLSGNTLDTPWLGPQLFTNPVKLMVKISQLYWQHFKIYFNVLDSVRKKRMETHSQWHMGLCTANWEWGVPCCYYILLYNYIILYKLCYVALTHRTQYPRIVTQKSLSFGNHLPLILTSVYTQQKYVTCQAWWTMTLIPVLRKPR